MQLAAKAGFSPCALGNGASHFRHDPDSGESVPPRHIGEGASAACKVTLENVKMPKFNGKTPQGIFIAPFEL